MAYTPSGDALVVAVDVTDDDMVLADVDPTAAIWAQHWLTYP